MKQFLFTTLFLSSALVSAQDDCNGLFLSAYVEGYSNNRAVEIYNPTTEAVNMSDYSVGRFSNGSTEFVGWQLQDAILEPGDVYVVVLDKRDPEGAGYEEPIWNGYVALGPLVDEVTGELVLDEDGNEIISALYDAEGGTEYGDEYNAEYDLEGLANEFACPIYGENNALYHNGNDAVALIEGTAVELDGSNVLDVVGVIGVDPGESWVDADGGWVTKDHTLKRKAEITQGTGIVLDEFDYEQWEIYPKNTFTVLGAHTSACTEVAANIQDITANQFTISPNPASSIVTIAGESPIEHISIMNLAGQIVKEIVATGETTHTLDIEDLQNGVYILSTITTNGKVTSKKLLVQ